MRYLRAANALLQGWAALIALGVAPTLVAVAGGLVALFGGVAIPILLVALVFSLAVNLYVAARAIRSRLRQLAFEREWARQQAEIDSQPQPEPERTDWLPDAEGNPTASNADLDRVLERATEAAVREIGPYAKPRLALIGLEDKTVIFHVHSRAEHKSASIMVDRLGNTNVYSKERWEPTGNDVDEDDAPLWRIDGSWVNLLIESWRIERPFVGNVYLWPISRWESADGLGVWRLCYIPEVEGFRSKQHCYVLQNGSLTRHPIPKPPDLPKLEQTSAG